MATVISGGLGRWPQALWKSLEGRLEGLSGDHVHVPLDDVCEVCACGHERRLEVRQDLFGLSHDVAFSDDRSRGVDRILPSDVDRLRRACHHNHVGEGGAFGKALGVYMFDLSAS